MLKKLHFSYRRASLMVIKPWDATHWRATTVFFTPTCPTWCPPAAQAAALSRQSVYSPPLSKGPNPPPQARFTPPPPPQLRLMPERLSCPAALVPRGLSLRCSRGEVFHCGDRSERSFTAVLDRRGLSLRTQSERSLTKVLDRRGHTLVSQGK